MTERERAVLRDRVARARLPKPQPRRTPRPPKTLEERNADLERQNEWLAQQLTYALRDDHRGWLEAERHILVLRRRIAQLEADR